MKIMKYQAATERQAMLLAREELGKDALILSIKSIKPKGIFRWLRKPYVEITAAIDENQEKKAKPEDKELAEFKSFLQELSNKQRELEELTQKRTESLPAKAPAAPAVPVKASHSNQEMAEDSQVLIGQVIYEQLIENEVDSKLADKLLADLLAEARAFDLEEGLNFVYRKIVKELSEIEPINIRNGRARPVFFIGSTGVGKTTTIAKLASLFTLEKKCKVALITADTYRIAAVEQLRTYANILNIPIRVIYKEEEIMSCIEEFSDCDLILIDTAGRSYQDTHHLEELRQLLEQVEEKQIYLVLSLSTKNSDLKKTVAAYDFADFSLIFTKLDETLAYGSILNLKYETTKPLSYITTGQNVPEDIAELDPYEVASKILGGVNS